VTDLSKKAECLGVPGERVDGMDVLAVRECVTEHVRLAREERKPTLVEALTYRFRGHSAADPEVYRTKDEVREWREQRDPIELFASRLKEAGMLDDDEYAERDRRAIERIDEATAFADASPEPALESLYDNVYVLGDQVQGWYTVDERTPEVHRGEDEHEVGAAGTPQELAEAGAAYAGAGDVQKRRRARHGEDEQEGSDPADSAQKAPRDADSGGEPSPEDGR
jgi:hypothetical protein